MIDPNKKPTGKQIEDLKFHLEGVWRDAHIHWGKVDTFYNRTYAIWPEELPGAKRSSYHLSKATNIVDHVVDT